MTARKYFSAHSFKQALEQRLRSTTNSGIDFTRKRQLLVFDRFLARVAAVLGNSVTLKGGLVLELRLDHARTTRDVDLRMMGSPEATLTNLQRAARLDLGDLLVFEIVPDQDHPQIQNEGMQYEGLRFRARCTLAGSQYGQPFGVDASFGEPILGEPETIVAEDLLGFAGIAPPRLRVYPIESHIAEKLHAYTMPRSRPNSRVKDLPDLALLATVRAIEARRLRDALKVTFAFRKTHPLPIALPDPPPAWSAPYAAMANENGLAWPTIAGVTMAAQAFLDPILGNREDTIWQPGSWTWQAR
jgi:hypothetical protein